MPELIDIEFTVTDGYWPSTSNLPPDSFWRTIKAGSNMWLRPGNRLEVANGIAQTSAQNVGARIFTVNTQRGEIAGGLTGGRLPYNGLIRYLNAVLMFLSEQTSQQVYLDESALSGVTTSTTAGRLRIAIPGSGGSYTTVDAGFDPPATGTVTRTVAGGSKGMNGQIGTALCAWRSATNAVSGPSATTYDTFTAASNEGFTVALPAAISGQDGWVIAGTRWDDLTAELRVVRYIYITARGTFTATNGSPNLTAGSGTFFMRDLRAGDIVTIGGGSYTISAVTSNTTATLTANYTGSTGSQTATITTAFADWYDSELGDLVDRNAIKPPVAAGILQFNNRAFLWGTYGASGNPTGPAITPLLVNNPEHVAAGVRFNILTSTGADIVNVLPGDETLYVMTKGTLEVVTLRDDPNEPYSVRAYDGVAGFVSPGNGVIFKNRFYGYSGRPIRTTTQFSANDVDVEFAQAVDTDMAAWSAQNVVVLADPENACVLYCHFVAAIPPASEGITTVIPYMAQIGRWGVPHQFDGQVTSGVVVNGQLYLSLVTSSGNYRVQTWEGGSGASNAYISTQIVSQPARWRIKSFLLNGRADSLVALTHSPAGTSTDTYTTTLGPSSFMYEEIFANLQPARGLQIKLNFPASGGAFDRLAVRGYPLAARR